MVTLKWHCTDPDFPFCGQINAPMPRRLAESIIKRLAPRFTDYCYWVEEGPAASAASAS